MLPPHELKNKEFPKVMRGYSIVDVDENIEFIIQKYTELYRANDELERKLQKAEADLKEFKNDEESIRSALINAQKASAKIISEANERADVIIRSAKTNCDKIVAEFNEQIIKEREKLIDLRKVISEFKLSLFNQYTSHIEYVESIAPDIEEKIEEQLANDDYTKLVVERIKQDISAGVVQEYGDALPKPSQVAEEISEAVEKMPAPIEPPPELPDIEPEEIIEPESESAIDFDDIISSIPKKEPKPKVLFTPEPEPELDIEPEIDPESEPEPLIEIKHKPVINEKSKNKTLSMKDRIKELNKKFDDSDDEEIENEDFDEDYENFVKTIETNRKKTKNKPRPVEDDDTYEK